MRKKRVEEEVGGTLAPEPASSILKRPGEGGRGEPHFPDPPRNSRDRSPKAVSRLLWISSSRRSLLSLLETGSKHPEMADHTHTRQKPWVLSPEPGNPGGPRLMTLL